VFLTVVLLGAGRLAAWLAAFHVWLNGEAARGREYLLSDHFALLLVALGVLTLVWAYRRGTWRWLLAGAVFAALTLTKAVFMWMVAPALVLALAAVVIRRERRRALVAWGMFALAYAAPVGTWMERNHEVGGTYALSIGRTATALSTREVFDHMTPAQYTAAFVYWTRAMGDGLAKQIFPMSVWGPFDLDRPGGFYLVGQHRLTPEAQALVAKGMSDADAEKLLERRMISAILERPLAYATSTLPLIWRGIWVDEFIVFSLPALVWLAWSAATRRLDIAFAIGPGLFSLVFYALVSLNIPRYQLTAVPALAVSFGIGASAVIDMLRRRWRNRKPRSAEG
jgi:4-amino-4-deoxy-L-arabinose transferase-like glycosyltransferase